MRTSHIDRSLDRTAELLRGLADLYAVPDHEWPVRRFVLESLPEWARDRAIVDDMGNVIVEGRPRARHHRLHGPPLRAQRAPHLLGGHLRHVGHPP